MILGHGIGGIRDLPVPTSLFFYGAATVLVVSFVALAVLWRRPLLEPRAGGRPLPPWLQGVLLSRALRAVLGAVSFALLVGIWLTALIGKPSSGANLAPTFVYVLFWVGLVPFVVLLGDVWSALSPWKAAADLGAWASRRLGAGREPSFAYPERLGRWPAAALLFAFATMELAYVDPASPRALAVAIALYSALTWAGAAAFGREAWFAHGDGFSVYFGLLSRIAPLAKVDGRIVARLPFSGLAVRERVPGTIAFVAVMLGSVLFDGFSRTGVWQDRYYDVQVELLDRPALADLTGTLLSLAGLGIAVGLVGLAFRLAVAGTQRIAAGGEDLPGAFAASLVPIALVYVVAHYFSLLVLQGQVGVRLLSDPLGRGWDLFGTRSFEPDFTVLTPNAIWYVAVVSLVVGHVAGLALAHDRAVGLHRSPRTAMWSQYPMLVLMVCYTVGGLWVLSQG